MKLYYALGIKKIIILWIVVFLGGYVLNSFFEKINSLDEGLNATSHKILPGFQIEYWNTRRGRGRKVKKTYWNKTQADKTRKDWGGTVKSTDKIRVSMVANNTPAPASVQSSTAEGCGGPRFGKFKDPGAKPFNFGNSWSRFGEAYRKLSKSECAKLLRNEACPARSPNTKKAS